MLDLCGYLLTIGLSSFYGHLRRISMNTTFQAILDDVPVRIIDRKIFLDTYCPSGKLESIGN
jgi:hypothetical protein